MGQIVGLVGICICSVLLDYWRSQFPAATVIEDGQLWPCVEQPEWQTPAMVEWHLNATLSADQVRKMSEDELAEMTRMGLIERAQTDFRRRLRNASVEKWVIGYSWCGRDTVWCDVRYHMPGTDVTQHQEFSYTRAHEMERTLKCGVHHFTYTHARGTRWTLKWRVHQF